jgi:PEGA domain
MTRSTAVSLVVALAAVLASAAPAAAQSRRAAAEASFRKGKALMGAGKIADACSAFAESQKLDPQLGTEYNLAVCYEKVGKLTSAWVDYNELAAKDTNPGRRADSARRAKRLEPRLTKMVLKVAQQVPGLTVTQDGADVTVLVGVETPVDAGTYQFKASAPGYADWTDRIELSGEGKTTTVEVPVLDQPHPAGGTETPPAGGGTHVVGGGDHTPPAGGLDKEPPPAVHASSSPGKMRKILGIGSAGAGVVAVGLGLWFGSQASSLNGEAKDLCGGAVDMCDPANLDAAQAKVDDARSKATVSTVLVGVGAAAIAGGVILFVTAPKAHPAEHARLTPVVAPDRVGFALSGRF